MPQPAPGISVRREGSHVAIEDYDVEHGKAVLTRVSLLDAATAVRIGREMVRLGTEAALEGTKTLPLAHPSREGTAR